MAQLLLVFMFANLSTVLFNNRVVLVLGLLEPRPCQIALYTI